MAFEFSWPHTIVPDLASAMDAWNEHASLVGGPANGIIIRQFPLRTGQMAFNTIQNKATRGTVMSRRKEPHVILSLPSGAQLRISPVTGIRDALSLAGLSFTWMAIDDPATWQNHDLIERVIMTLNSQELESRLIGIGSPFRFISQPVKVPDVPDGDDLDLLVAPQPIVHIAFPSDKDAVP